jgi:LmbE family N-acetylglucosaminyl deacetylase
MTRRVLAVFAHPDDECLVAGGTLAAYGAAGAEVRLISMTCGEAGPIAPGVDATRETLGAVRQRELGEAARVLGISCATCLAHPDGDLASADEEAIAGDLARRIEAWRPDTIITFGPEGLYWHDDHIAVHRLVSLALNRAAPGYRRPRVYCATWPDGLAGRLLAAMRVRGLDSSLWSIDPDAFGASPDAITEIVDVGTFVQLKLAALRCHQSQLEPGNVFQLIPDDLAVEFLGNEYFSSTPFGSRESDS